MAELLYDFFLNTFINSNLLPNQELLATLLTWASLVLIFGALVKFVIWLFKAPFRGGKWRD